MPQIDRDRFTRSLSQAGAFSIARMSPQLSAAFEKAGISGDDLRDIAGTDEVIQGSQEYEELYQKLKDLDARSTSSAKGTVELDRAGAIYSAILAEIRSTEGRPPPPPTERGRGGITGIHARKRPDFSIEQVDDRPSRRARTNGELLAARESLAQRTFDNLRAAGFLTSAQRIDDQLPAPLMERFRAAFPAEQDALHGRSPTHRDLLLALARDHDGNGTADIRVHDCINFGLFPPAVTATEAAAILLGAGGRGVIARPSDFLHGAARRAGATSHLELVPTDGAREALPHPDVIRATALLLQGEVGAATLLKEILVDPRQIGLLAAVAKGASTEAAERATRMLCELSVSDEPELRREAEAALDDGRIADADLIASETVEALGRSHDRLLARAADLDSSAKKQSSAVYGDARGRRGIRSILAGASKVPSAAEELIYTANLTRTLLADNLVRSERAEVLLGRLAPQAQSRPRLEAALLAIHQQRAALLETAAKVAVSLERTAFGLADDTGWTRASYATHARRKALDAAGRLLADVRSVLLREIDAQRLGDARDPIALGRLSAVLPELERAMVDGRAHVRTFESELRSALGNDRYRVQVLEATRDTIALILAHFPSDPALAKRALEGDAAAKDQLAKERADELRAFGVDPEHLPEAWAGKSTLAIVVDLAKAGDSAARARLAIAEDQLQRAIGESTKLLENARATPAQLDAMRTLGRIVSRYDFTSDDLASFDLGKLEDDLARELSAAGLHGITPKVEIDRMREIHRQAKQFTLLTDLSAGVIEHESESGRDENAARRLARDEAMRDPQHAYAVVRDTCGGKEIFRVRKLDRTDSEAFRQLAREHGKDADEGVAQTHGAIYVVSREGASLDESDRYSEYTSRREAANAFRPQAEGGQSVYGSVSTATQSELYRVMFERASSRVAARYRTAISALDQYGVGKRPDAELFKTRMQAVLQKLKTQNFDPPTIDVPGRGAVPRGLAQLEQICMLLGERQDSARELAGNLWSGRTTFTYYPPAMDEYPPPPVELDICSELSASGRGAYERFHDRLLEVLDPYEGTSADVAKGRDQVFSMYNEFPDLAEELYRQQGFSALTGFPPRSKPGVEPASAAERLFLEDATAWQAHEERMGYLKTGGLIAAGILITVASGGALGPEVAAAAGVIFAAGTSGYEVLKASEALGKASDARAVGAASDQTVRFRENELVGAYGALIINVATAGLASKIGGGQLASSAARLGLRTVIKEAVVGVGIGAGAGALTAAANPNTYASPNVFGVILRGAIVGGIGGGVGTIGGRFAQEAAQPIGRRIAVAFAKTPSAPRLQVGSEVQVSIEGQSAPEPWRVRSIDDGRGRLELEKDGRRLVLSIREAEALTVDEANPSVTALRALAQTQTATAPAAPDPTTPSVPDRSPLVGAPAAVREARATPPRATQPIAVDPAEGPSAEFVQRLGREHPLLADAVERMAGSNAAIRGRALGAAERNPLVRGFIEAGGPHAARLVGELGETAFLSLHARLGSRHGELLMQVAEQLGIDPALRLARVSEAAPDGLSFVLGRRNGRQQVMRMLASDPEALVALANNMQGRIFLRTGDGVYLMRGDAPHAVVPDQAALEALALRAGLDRAVLDDPTSHPREISRLIDRMRAEMDPAHRTAFDLEILGRRFVDEPHYDEARRAGVQNPELRYGRRDFQNWWRAESIIMNAARRGRPITVDLLRRVHAEASRGIMDSGALGRLRSLPNETAHQGGRGIGIQEVTPEQLRALKDNPDLDVYILDREASGNQRVMVGYTSPEKVAARAQQIVDRVNARIAAGDDPVEIAADAQREMVSVHPFSDGNGRTSRLLMDYVLARAGLPPSVLADPNIDTHVSAARWRQEVRNGLKRPLQSAIEAWANATGAGSKSPSGPLVSAQDAREQALITAFLRGGEGRTEADARALFVAAGGRRTDPITGFLPGDDLAPTLDSAITRVKQGGEPAVVVRASLRNLGGMNAELAHSKASDALGEVAAIIKAELDRTGSTVLAFREGPEMSFLLSSRDLPQASVDEALVRAQSRIAAKAKELGLDRIDHPKHPSDPLWRGTGISTTSARILPTDTAEGIDAMLSSSLERYNTALGQVPGPSGEGRVPANDVTAPAGGPTPAPVRRAKGAPRFLSQVELRAQALIEAATSRGVARDEALRLFAIAGGSACDPITGYARAADRVPTIERAIDWAKRSGENAFYVDIDIRNLGGLNRAVGRAAADRDVRIAADLIKSELGAIGADISLIRHGGDELSAVIVGPRVERASIDAALSRAHSRFDAYVRARGLADLPHTKNPDDPSKRGVGFTFVTEQARATDDVASILGRADVSLEAMKKRGSER
jgi:GGDEF domain-containing protein/prophage maintenance system killer protein